MTVAAPVSYSLPVTNARVLELLQPHLANGTCVFCVPGSSGACATAWDALKSAQLDLRTRPCTLVEMMPRLTEK